MGYLTSECFVLSLSIPSGRPICSLTDRHHISDQLKDGKETYIVLERERETEREREREKERERQTDRQTKREKDSREEREIEKRTQRKRKIERGRKSERDKIKETECLCILEDFNHFVH